MSAELNLSEPVTRPLWRGFIPYVLISSVYVAARFANNDALAAPTKLLLMPTLILAAAWGMRRFGSRGPARGAARPQCPAAGDEGCRRRSRRGTGTGTGTGPATISIPELHLMADSASALLMAGVGLAALFLAIRPTVHTVLAS